MPDQTPASQSAEICGEVGTSFTTDHEPHYTAPCSLPAGHDEPHDWAQREAAGEPSPAETIENLRFRIADPGAFLAREHDQDDDGTRIDETAPTWAARAVAAGLDDGTLGYIPASRLADVQEDLARTIDEADQLRRELDTTRTEADHAIAELAALKQHAAHLFAGVDAAYRFANKLDADCCGTYARQLRDAIGKASTAPVPGSSQRAQEPELVPGEHLWQSYDDRITYCRWCGVVQRRDGANKPCKGVVPVELREKPAGESQASEPAPEDLRWHVGRHWMGNEIEKTCPCPKEPCGLVDPTRAVPECEHHPVTRGKSIRQSHRAHQCHATEPAAPKLATGGIIRRDQAVIVGDRPIDPDDRAARPDAR